jgi:Skp family chaperone for outer membrane proteins
VEFDPLRFHLEQASFDAPDALARAATQLTLSSESSILLLVDQFEEIFRFNRRAGDELEWYERSNRFVQQLLTAANALEGLRKKLHIVLTMRDEFVGRCASFPGLAEAMNAGMYLVPRLSRIQLADAVRLPARVCNKFIAPSLVERIVNDSVSVQDELPVLQHAMMRTWLNVGAHATTIQLSDYETEGVGTAHRALDRHGDEILASTTGPTANRQMSERQRRLAAVLFKRLTLDTGEESTRSPATIEEIASVAEVPWNDSDLFHVIDVFRAVDCQFISPGPSIRLLPSTEIDLSHEAILRNWLQLKSWAEDERADAETYRRLVDAAIQHDRDPTYQGVWLEPQLSAMRSWWERKKPSAAWAARYHPSSGKFSLEQRPRFSISPDLSTSGRPSSNVSHDALLTLAERFLVESESHRDAEIDARRRGQMLKWLTVLIALLLLVSGPSGVWIVSKRAQLETKRALLEAKRAQLEKATSDARRAEAEANASGLRRDALEAKAKLAQSESETKSEREKVYFYKTLEPQMQSAKDAERRASRARRTAEAELTVAQKIMPQMLVLIQQLSARLCETNADTQACELAQSLSRDSK